MSQEGRVVRPAHEGRRRFRKAASRGVDKATAAIPGRVFLQFLERISITFSSRVSRPAMSSVGPCSTSTSGGTSLFSRGQRVAADPSFLLVPDYTPPTE